MPTILDTSRSRTASPERRSSESIFLLLKQSSKDEDLNTDCQKTIQQEGEMKARKAYKRARR
jgi:hypothetical protein